MECLWKQTCPPTILNALLPCWSDFVWKNAPIKLFFASHLFPENVFLKLSFGCFFSAVKGSHILVSETGAVLLSGLRESHCLSPNGYNHSFAYDFPTHAVTTLPWLAPEVLEQVGCFFYLLALIQPLNIFYGRKCGEPTCDLIIFDRELAISLHTRWSIGWKH